MTINMCPQASPLALTFSTIMIIILFSNLLAAIEGFREFRVLKKMNKERKEDWSRLMRENELLLKEIELVKYHHRVVIGLEARHEQLKRKETGTHENDAVQHRPG